LTGGQNITVTGFGFNSKNIDAKIDGVSCTVTSYKEDSFDCTVNKKDAKSVTGDQVGQHGVRREFWNFAKEADPAAALKQWHSVKAHKETLRTSTETPYNEGSSLANRMKGWFVPPATTKYRFYMSCSTKCKLLLGETSGSTSSPTKILETSDKKLVSEFRNYHGKDSAKRLSVWKSLEKDKPYYMEFNT